jgi:molybdopterin-guanine dinucleotide biosynthesis protein A
MLGIILCGGQSTRMGDDKGLLVHEAKTWGQTALDKLSVLNIPVKISVNEEQQSEYAKVFTSEMLITDRSSLSIKGPLSGVLSAHLHNPNDDLFVFACDLPLMEPIILKELLTLYLADKKYEVYIFTNDNEPEPLCGIYTSKSLAKIVALHNEKKLTRHSMKFILGQLSVCTIAIKEEQKKYFRNFNAHADINGL